MRVQQNYSNLTTKGIELTTINKNNAKQFAKQLERAGFSCLGKKSIYCNNSLTDIIKQAQEIRKQTHFGPRKFGLLDFVWSKKYYLVASPTYEQLLYPCIKQYDKDATINLAI